jgi:hypothetical protein
MELPVFNKGLSMAAYFRIGLLLLIATLASKSTIAYEIRSHMELSQIAAAMSVLGDDARRKRLGVLFPIDSRNLSQQFQASDKHYYSVLELIRRGSAWEDNFPPGPVYHFFNPRTNSPLYIDPSTYSVEVGQTFLPIINASTRISPDWALNGQGALVPPFTNPYSWMAAREYMFLGAVGDSSSQGKLFESIGRMVHHIQDMAQPQHVRNDNHLSHETADSICETLAFYPWCTAYHLVRRPSLFESWIDAQLLHQPLQPIDTYRAAYPGVGDPPDGIAVFSSARLFWANAGRGIADYTNRNFYSAGTLDIAPPEAGQPYEIELSVLCSSTAPPCPSFGIGDERVTFFPSVVDDQFRTDVTHNYFAKSASIFDPEFYSATSKRLESLNRFTFEATKQFVLPRAIGYSAGLINYFFRGDMEISAPDEGVYAIADTSDAGCTFPCGFGKIKLKLRNITPGEEPMGRGELAAVARYHTNDCYKRTLAGEYGGPAFLEGAQCRSAMEAIAVSERILVGDLQIPVASKAAFSFDFSRSPIPINASDLTLSIVFRGKLGSEEDAVVVATANVSEPNFIAAANVTDYIYDDVGDKKYHRLPYGNARLPVSVEQVGIGFAGASAPIATIPVLSGGQFARLAILSDVGDLSAIVFHSGVHDPDWTLQTEEFGLDVSDKYVRSCPLFESRGLFWEYLFFWHREVDNGDNAIEGSDQLAPPASNPTGRLVASGGKRQAQPKYAYKCSVPSGGFYDLSSMQPFDVNQALTWSIRF